MSKEAVSNGTPAPCVNPDWHRTPVDQLDVGGQRIRDKIRQAGPNTAGELQVLIDMNPQGWRQKLGVGGFTAETIVRELEKLRTQPQEDAHA